MKPATYLDHIRADGEALAATARAAPAAPVPTCPEWDMTGLVAHLGGVHRWVDRIVQTRAAAYVKRESTPPDGSQATLEWYEEGLAQMLTTLGGTDPDAAVWNWFDGAPAPARFWLRRMAHETAIHRWDAQMAAGNPDPIATDLAVDGIDEFLTITNRWLARQPVDLHGTLHLHATDTDTDGDGDGDGDVKGEWSLVLMPDRVEYRREHAKADAALRGPVSDLVLWMLNRVPADAPGLQAFGDRAIIDGWGQLQF